jgi:hypothetical protein
MVSTRVSVAPCLVSVVPKHPVCHEVWCTAMSSTAPLRSRRVGPPASPLQVMAVCGSPITESVLSVRPCTAIAALCNRFGAH